MENIRLPEDFTDRVMQRIEVRERAAARRARATAVAGGILGGAFLIAAAVIILRRYNIDLSSFTEGFRRIEQQMLHEVGQSVLAFALVARTGMYRETGIRDLRRDKLVNHLQPVGQHICRIIGHNKNFYATKIRQ